MMEHSTTVRLLQADKITPLPSVEIAGMVGAVFEAEAEETFTIEVEILGDFLRNELKKGKQLRAYGFVDGVPLDRYNSWKSIDTRKTRAIFDSTTFSGKRCSLVFAKLEQEDFFDILDSDANAIKSQQSKQGIIEFFLELGTL